MGGDSLACRYVAEATPLARLARVKEHTHIKSFGHSAAPAMLGLCGTGRNAIMRTCQLAPTPRPRQVASPPSSQFMTCCDAVCAPPRLQLDGRADMDEMQDALRELTGARSVPRVFVGGKFLGGGDDTAAAAANGTLKKLLQEAGAL